MSTTTTVHVLRHGEVFNPAKILYGRLPGFHLSELGVQMAEVAAGSLKNRDVTHVVASPLERAQETAEPIAAEFGLEIATDTRLIESANYFEGRKVSLSPRNWWVFRDPITPSWGEPYLTIAQRMFAALQAARVAAEGHVAEGHIVAGRRARGAAGRRARATVGRRSGAGLGGDRRGG